MTMKKTLSLKFLVLSALLMVGNLVALAASKYPGAGVMVGASVKVTVNGVEQSGLVVYEVAAVAGKAVGDDIAAVPVKITGLDRDGLAALAAGNIDLVIPTDFTEKYGTGTNQYYVEQIVDGWDGVGETYSAFYGYPQLTTLEFVSNGFTTYAGYTVGKYAFYGCTKLTSLKFTDNKVKSIGNRCFQNTAITEFEIPQSCASIGEYAFYNCQKLGTVTVASNNTVLTTIGTHVFGNSTLHVLDLTNAKNFTTFTGEPFLYEGSVVNHQLNTVKLPANFTTLNHAFDNCTGLTSINLEATKCSAVDDANSFVNCSALESLTIPATATVAGAPFALCSKLATLTFNAYTSGTNNGKIVNPIGTAGKNLYDASGVAGATAAQKAASLAALETLTFQAGKTFSATINNGAFVGCTGLKTVNFCKLQDATIGAAFTDVESLTALNIEGITSPNATTAATTTFKTDAFKNTGLTALTIPAINNKANVTFEKDAFGDNASLATVEFKDITTAGNVTIDGDGTDGAFEDNDALTLVTFNKVNTGTLAINDAAFAGNDALAKVKFGLIGDASKGGTVVINDGAFAANPALAEVEFAGVAGAKDKTSVGIGAGALVFGDATAPSLAKVTFGDITAQNFVIGAGAFASKAMKEVTFGNVAANIFTINNSAFAGDTSTDVYEKVTFGNITAFNGANNTFGIGNYAFDGGKSKKVVTFGTITDYNKDWTTGFGIGQRAFRGAKSVVFDVIKAKTVMINDEAFKGDNLASVEFKGIQNVTDGTTTVTIKDKAFAGNELVAKTVKFGAINQAKYTDANNISLDIQANAFQLGTKSVEFGDIKANSIYIGATAFTSDKLESVTFGNLTVKDFDIAGQAFEGNDDANATTFASVTFGNITNWADGTNGANATYYIADKAFNGGQKDIVFGTIKNSGNFTTTVTVADAADANAGAFRGVKTAQFGDFQATAIKFGDYAFYGDNLQSVKFGTVKNPTNAAGALTIDPFAFASVNTTEQVKTVEFGDIDRAATTAANTLTVAIDDNAFKYGVETVTFKKVTAQSLTIGDNAFQSDYLKTVSFGNVTANTFTIGDFAFVGSDAYTAVTIGNIAPLTADATVTVGDDAFNGGVKDVKIGNLAKSTTPAYALNVTIGDNAFEGTKTVEIGKVSPSLFEVGVEAFMGTKLESVKIGEFDCASYEIKAKAFQGGKLASVDLGNFKSGATKATIAADAFKSNNTTDVIAETIKLGNLNSTKLNIAAGAFQGPQKDGSSYTLTMGNIASKPEAIAAGAFKAAPKGEAKITIKNVTADVTTIAAAAFQGSQENKTTPAVNTTSIDLGNINYAFNDGTFTNVNDVTMKNVNVLVDVNAFADAADITVKGDIAPAATFGNNMFKGTGANALKVKSLVFEGSVGKVATDGASNVIGTFDSPLVRKIEFPTAEYAGATADPANVEVHTGAVAAGAFAAAYAAAKAAAPQENILVKYYCEEINSRAGHQIFNVNAFSATPGDDKLVILYTNEWAKANIFESGATVNGLDYSLSTVTPGTEVETAVVKSAKNAFYYGKLYLPSGSGQYKIAREPAAGVTVNVYEGRIDGEAIYMKKIDTYENIYWIDAADMDQVFVVRSTAADAVKAEPVTAADDEYTTADDFYYYDKSDGKKNSLQYSYAGVVNTELQNSEPYRSKNIYVMANPATAGFAFAKLDQFATTRNLAAKSLYVLGKKSASARLTVIWDDEDDTDAIEGVTPATEQNDAIYNLNGVRVQKAQKGIFIINGKKVVK